MLILKDKFHNILPWETNNFPDGQQQFKMLESNSHKVREIRASIPNPQELDLFLQAFFTLKKYHPEVTINYFYGARSDKNSAGEWEVNNTAQYFNTLLQGLSDVIIQSVNGQIMSEYRTPFISCLAPHCKLGSEFHSDYAINRFKEFNESHVAEYDCVVFPDESALERFEYLTPVCKKYVVCEKHRDQVTGQIVSHKIPELAEDCPRMLVIDDLCDGGLTFLKISDSKPPNTQMDLFIFHGVFTNHALQVLLNRFYRVIVTNSLPAPEKQKIMLGQDSDRVLILDVW